MTLKTAESGPSATDPPKPSLNRRKLAFVGVAVCIGALITLIAFEVLLRVLWGSPRLPVPPGMIRADAVTGTSYTPNYRGVVNTPFHRNEVAINSHGLHDHEHEYEKPSGVFRVLVLGDSYVEGHGVRHEEAFTAVAERLLDERLQAEQPNGRTIEFIRAGVGGWGPVNELNYLLNEGVRYDPDLVLVAFFLGNDFQDAENPERFVAYDGIRLERRIAINMTTMRAIRIRLRKHIYTYGLLVDIAKGLNMSRRDRFGEDRGVLGLCNPRRELSIAATTDAIERFGAWAEEHDVNVAFLILPHRIQVERDRLEEVSGLFALDLSKFDLDRPSALLGTILRSNSIAFEDVTPHLRAWSAENGEIGLGGDSHYRADVHEVVGRRVAEFLAPMITTGNARGLESESTN